MRMPDRHDNEVASVLRHLLDQAHVTIEGHEAIEQALSNCEAVSASQMRSTMQAIGPAAPSQHSTTAGSPVA
jgi:hypothetical protein